MSKRIDWVDIAKGVAIILMVIGHTIPYNNLNILVFSFHMPLFIILSGITYKIPKDKKQVKSNFVKYVKKLLLPYLITLLICTLIVYVNNNNTLSVFAFFKQLIKNLLWGNGCDYILFGIKFVGVGPIWFLITLFFSKVLFDVINIQLNKKGLNTNIVFYCFLLLIGIEIGLVSWLPQGFDLMLIFLFYLYVGYLFRNYFDKIKINKNLLFVIAFIIWGICLGFNTHIELAMRKYPFNVLSVIESLCASYCVIEMCKIIAKNKLMQVLLTNVGVISLIILCVHSVEYSFVDWKSLPLNIYLVSILRVMAVLIVSMVVHNLFIKISSLRKSKA